MWFETIIPGFEEGFFVIAQPPTEIPQPELGQNELLVIEMNLTIEDYKGMETKVPFTSTIAAVLSDMPIGSVPDKDSDGDEIY